MFYAAALVGTATPLVTWNGKLVGFFRKAMMLMLCRARRLCYILTATKYYVYSRRREFLQYAADCGVVLFCRKKGVAMVNNVPRTHNVPVQ